MKRYLIPDDGFFYKANLHTHSKISDGQSTASELKEDYKNHGYSILALTDHELLVDHSELSDKDFLFITGVEYAICELPPSEYYKSKTIEFNLYAKDPHNVTQICFDPSTVYHGETWRKDIAKLSDEGIVKKEYTIEFLQHVIDEAQKYGFLVSLNHPMISMESPEFFGKLNGLFAMEIYNHGSSNIFGTFETNQQMYENMLRRGKMLYCQAADDCHLSKLNENDPHSDKFGGWIMIKAPKLDYSTIIDCLEKGLFYSSYGPEIKELYVENNKVHLLCSNAKKVIMSTAYRLGHWTVAANQNEYINEAVFDLPLQYDNPYMRFDVVDEFGRRANTHAYNPADYKD